jgi:hypothetical protein
MSEVLVLSLVSRIHPSLNLGIPNMSFPQHRPDSTSQVLGVHSIELGLTQSTKQVVDRLIVASNMSPSAYSTSGSSCHRSVEDPIPVPGTPSLDLIIVRVNQDP